MTYQRYTVRIRPDMGGGYWAEVPAVPGLACFGESLELVTANVRELLEAELRRRHERGLRPPAEADPPAEYVLPVTVRLPEPN